MLRPMMVHCQTVTTPKIARMAKCGTLASVFVGHCFYWGDTHLANFGPKRGNNISPLRTILDHGVIANPHQDSPITATDRLHSIWCAVNCRMRSGVMVSEGQKIDVYDALIAATYGGACIYFEEHTKGILKPGVRADFVVLSDDPPRRLIRCPFGISRSCRPSRTAKYSTLRNNTRAKAF